MTEDEARSWIADRFDASGVDRVTRFAELVVAENQTQNLIAPGTVPTIWARHIVDSAQLILLAPAEWKHWLDIGTGGGFPGMVIAALMSDRAVTMVEPRRKRAEFLEHAAEVLDLPHASVVAAKVEQVEQSADVISARAVASVENLLRGAGQCATADTTWLLPRGRSGADDLNVSQRMFHVEHSVTDLSSAILVLKGDGR